MTYFKKNIDYLMRLGGFKTETDFSAYTGMPQPTINRLRSRTHTAPKRKTVSTIAEAFGITENDLINSDLSSGSVKIRMTGRAETNNIMPSVNLEFNKNMRPDTIQHFYGHKGNLLVACYDLLHINKMSSKSEVLERIIDLLSEELEKETRENNSSVDEIKKIDEI
jgi:Cro/C1-type HTH DNA-binding domain